MSPEGRSLSAVPHLIKGTSRSEVPRSNPRMRCMALTEYPCPACPAFRITTIRDALENEQRLKFGCSVFQYLEVLLAHLAVHTFLILPQPRMASSVLLNRRAAISVIPASIRTRSMHISIACQCGALRISIALLWEDPESKTSFASHRLT